MIAGPRNLITDIPGLRVGNAEDHTIKTGVTVLTADRPFLASVDVMGGAPGTRETDLLAPDRLVEDVDALVLSGGSAFGLDAASGVVEGLRLAGRGFRVGPAAVPIVPAAIVFDLLNGGAKNWPESPYPALGAQALAAAGAEFALGSAGAGTGAMTANLKGGLGSASLVLPGGYTVGALVVANPTGSVIMGDTPHFWAAPFEIGDEFGGLGTRPDALRFEETVRSKRDPSGPIGNTTIAIVATDALLTKAQARRLAVAAQDGIARGGDFRRRYFGHRAYRSGPLGRSVPGGSGQRQYAGETCAGTCGRSRIHRRPRHGSAVADRAGHEYRDVEQVGGAGASA